MPDPYIPKSDDFPSFIFLLPALCLFIFPRRTLQSCTEQIPSVCLLLKATGLRTSTYPLSLDLAPVYPRVAALCSAGEAEEVGQGYGGGWAEDQSTQRQRSLCCLEVLPPLPLEFGPDPDFRAWRRGCQEPQTNRSPICSAFAKPLTGDHALLFHY